MPLCSRKPPSNGFHLRLWEAGGRLHSVSTRTRIKRVHYLSTHLLRSPSAHDRLSEYMTSISCFCGDSERVLPFGCVESRLAISWVMFHYVQGSIINWYCVGLPPSVWPLEDPWLLSHFTIFLLFPFPPLPQASTVIYSHWFLYLVAIIHMFQSYKSFNWKEWIVQNARKSLISYRNESQCNKGMYGGMRLKNLALHCERLSKSAAMMRPH